MANEIIKQTLPADQNFHILKTQGIAYLEELSGTDWSNFNDSDPGITTLDQLCYALTELGYCIDFPINDVLTKKNGKIPYKNHFYSPEKILTCSPISINDYRTFLLDQVSELQNVYFSDDTFYLFV